MSIGYGEALREIGQGRLKPVYLLCGEEEYLQDAWLDALKASVLEDGDPALNYEGLDGSRMTAAQAVDQANTLPFFSQKKILVIKHPEFVKAAKKDKQSEDLLMKYIEDPLTSTCLVLWCPGSFDKRSRYYKVLEKQGRVVEIAKLKGAELTRWIQGACKKQGIALTEEAMREMAGRSMGDLRFLSHEIQKLALYYNPAGAGTARVDLDGLNAVMTPGSEAGIFDLVDYIGQKKGEKAIESLRTTLTAGEPPIRVLFMIARQFRLIFQAKVYMQQGTGEKAMAGEMGLHPFVAGKVWRQTSYYSLDALEAAVKLLRDCDLSLKSGASPSMTLEALILQLVTLT